jgi:hypothetical protein
MHSEHNAAVVLSGVVAKPCTAPLIDAPTMHVSGRPVSRQTRLCQMHHIKRLMCSQTGTQERADGPSIATFNLPLSACWDDVHMYWRVRRGNAFAREGLSKSVVARPRESTVYCLCDGDIFRDWQHVAIFSALLISDRLARSLLKPSRGSAPDAWR